MMRWLFILGILGVGLWGCMQEKVEVVPPVVDELPPAFQAEGEQVLRVVRLTPEQAKKLHIRVIKLQPVPARFVLSAPGIIYPAPTHQYSLSAPINGIVSAIYAHEGEQVSKGDRLLEMESLEFAQMVSAYLQAKAERAYREKQVARLEQLVRQRINPERELEKAKADLERARTLEQAAYASLKALGISDKQIRAWSTGEQAKPVLRFYAPISGIITQHAVELGKAVEAYQEMLMLVDPGRLLVKGFVDPAEARFVKPGYAVTLRTNNPSDEPVKATITTVNPSLQNDNRSLVLNILLDAVAPWLLPGRTVHLDIEARPEGPAIVIPLAAIVYDGKQSVVFVRKDSLTFVERPVKLRKISGHTALVTSGLRPGEEIAITQVYTLKALSRYEEFAEE